VTRYTKITTFEPTLGRLENASQLADVQSVIEEFRDVFSVDHMVYHWVNSKCGRLGVGTYSGAWVSRYIQQSYIRIDPVVLGGFQRFHPVDWKDLDWSSKAARAFQADALEHGVGRQGLSIPIRGPKGQYALFTISHNASDEAWAGFIETAWRDLILIAHYVNKKILDIEAEGVVDPSPVLSPRENETLTFLALGYSRAQVAHTLCISENTLRVYIESARYKLGAANTTHAVSLAVSRGLILL